MPKLSARGANMPSSPIRKLIPFATEAKERGVEVIHLNIGQPDIASPAEMINAIRNFDEACLTYTDSRGLKSYQDTLVTYYAKHKINITNNDLVVTNGGSEALLISLFSILDEADEVIVPEPFYANYNGYTQAGNIKIKPITSTIKDGFALPSIKEFERLINPKTKAILLCNPNNPTGYHYTKKELEQLRDIVIEHNLFLIVDEVYREFIYGEQEHISILTINGLDAHAVVIDSISKRFSACGARIGAIVSRNQEFITTVLKFAQTRLSPPIVAQKAAVAAHKTSDEYFEKVQKEYLARRNFVVDQLNQIEGVSCPSPGGAFYCVVELPLDNAEDFCKWLLTDFSQDGSTVMLSPASGFYSTPGLGKTQIRLAYVLNKTKLQKAIDCLKEALVVYRNKVESEQSM